jgi:hypothetical protein
VLRRTIETSLLRGQGSYTKGICKGREALRTVVSAELQQEIFLLTVTK